MNKADAARSIEEDQIRMTGRAFLVVRSVVERESDRAGFDHWYQTDHMPKAIRLLGAETGWRFWSRTEPAVHYAVYRYPDLARLENRSPEDRAELMREYESTWPDVTRTREVLEQFGEAAPA